MRGVNLIAGGGEQDNPHRVIHIQPWSVHPQRRLAIGSSGAEGLLAICESDGAFAIVIDPVTIVQNRQGCQVYRARRDLAQQRNRLGNDNPAIGQRDKADALIEPGIDWPSRGGRWGGVAVRCASIQRHADRQRAQDFRPLELPEVNHVVIDGSDQALRVGTHQQIFLQRQDHRP